MEKRNEMCPKCGKNCFVDKDNKLRDIFSAMVHICVASKKRVAVANHTEVA